MSPRLETARGPVRTDERALAPDVARGLMLLLIVVSNTTFFLWGTRNDGSTGQHPPPQGAADAVAQFGMVVGLDMRVYPLFAFLFGYGMTQLFGRQVAAGSSERDAVRLLRRRSLWLLLFGFVHAALLLSTDVLGSYGLLSLILGALFLLRPDRALLRVAGIGAGVLLLLAVLGVMALTLVGTGAVPPEPASSGAEAVTTPELSGAAEPNYLVSMLYRLPMWGVLVLVTVLGFTTAVSMLLGMWAARHRFLEEPGAHLRWLRRAAVVGLAIGWLGALPAALVQVDAWSPPGDRSLLEGGLMALQWSTGPAGGVGYVAAFGLLAHWMSARVRVPSGVVAVGAIGKRSLSCYLTHSLLLGPVLAAWGLGFGVHLSSATGILYALGAWLVTLAGAYALERAGRRGPAERVLRRLIYRSPASSSG